MLRDIRILLVGDDNVGKSTLVTSLIKETFVSNVRISNEKIQHVVPEVTIPPEWTREKVTTKIVDSSARLENRDQLDAEIRKADVICIVYAINAPDSYNRISTFWLPHIRQLGRNVPVVLVGNKIDLRGKEISNDLLEQQVLPIMNEFKEVETCVECSAKQPLNVSEVFYFAQKAVLHPTAPLYDSKDHVLKPACVDALRRIFKLCDLNKNGFLDDDEIDKFQIKCFGSPLQKHELESVKNVVKENEPEGVKSQGLTEIGFLFLHTLFIQKGRLETTWTVLRTFGYGDDLSLKESFLFPTFVVPPDCSVELSADGYDFFIQLFEAHDKDKDGALNAIELEDLFSTTPGNPWEDSDFPDTTVTVNGSVTLQGFLAQWSMTTLLLPNITLSYLAYLGYPNEDTTSALKITLPRGPFERKRGKIPRNVFLAYVFGAIGSGKSSLIRAFLQKEFKADYHPTQRSFCGVNSVEIAGQEKYLVMQEFGPTLDAEVIQNRKKMDSCDVICLVYDSSDVNSFAYIAGLVEKYNMRHLPLVFIATKKDNDLVSQRYHIQPDAFCRELRVSLPVSISCKEKITADIFNMLVRVSINPFIATPGIGTKKWKKYFITAAISVAVVAIIGGVYYRHRNH